MKIIAIANQKGGTGKSTTAAAIAQAAHYKGLRCLAVDLDPQGNTSFFLNADTNTAGAFDLLEGTPAASVIQRTPQGIDTISANWSLQTIGTGTGSAWRLRKSLEPIRGKYDLIIIDTPPTAGELQTNAIMAGTDLIIPLLADVGSLQGLYQIADTARKIQQQNKDLKLTGYVLTRCGGRSTLARQMAEIIEARAKENGIPFLMAIREAVAIREAQSWKESLYDYAPKSKPAEDYLALLEMLTRRNGKQKEARSKATVNKRGAEL